MKDMLPNGIRQGKKAGAVIFDLFIQEDKSFLVEIRFLKTQFQFKLYFLCLFGFYADFLKGGIQFLNIFRIVCTVIIKLLADSQLILNVGIIFPLILRLRLFNLERAVSRSASDKLCFRYGGISRFAFFRVAGIVKPDNIK